VVSFTGHRGKFAQDRSFQVYCAEVGRTQMLSSFEELELFREYKRTGVERARDKLVHNCLRSVVKIANQYSNNPEVVKDLVSSGNLGILHALERYDPGRKTRFLSYATYWIKLFIRTELSNSSLVSMPLWRQKAIRKVRQIKRGVERSEGRQASSVEICDATDLTDTQLRRLEVDKFRYSSTETSPTLKTGKDAVLVQTIDRQAREILNSYVKQLQVKEQYVLRAYYGLCLEPMSLRQIARLLGVSSERVRQIKVVALERLKKLYKFSLNVECVDEICAD
jgi:RNA polymerase sigma factor (sigma-70 family)